MLDLMSAPKIPHDLIFDFINSVRSLYKPDWINKAINTAHPVCRASSKSQDINTLSTMVSVGLSDHAKPG